MYGTSNTSSTFDREKQQLQNLKNIVIPSKNIAALPSAHAFSSNNFSSASAFGTQFQGSLNYTNISEYLIGQLLGQGNYASVK
jgi:hypothetical protein